jgi:hypothetical protein
MRGSKPGERRGGRQRGARNKATLAREQAQAESAEKIKAALGASAFEGDAHALLMAVYKDSQQPMGLRLDAAKAAIGYEKPRLAAIEVQTKRGATLEELIMRAVALREERKKLTGPGIA